MSFSCIDDLLYSLAHVNTEELSEKAYNDFIYLKKKLLYIQNFYLYVPVLKKNTFFINIAFLSTYFLSLISGLSNDQITRWNICELFQLNHEDSCLVILQEK